MATNFLAPMNLLILVLFIYKTSLQLRNVASKDDLHPDYYVISPVLVELRLNEASFLARGTCAVHRFARMLQSTTQLRVALSCSGLIPLLLVILSGDISLNPGPNWRYPCSACRKPERPTTQLLRCQVSHPMPPSWR